MTTFKFPKQLPKEWIEAIERNGSVGSEVYGLKVVAKDRRGTIVHLGADSFKILHNGKNASVFGYTDIGPNPKDMESGGVGYIKGSIFTIPEAAISADSITVALKRAVAGSDQFRCAIYKHSDLSLVGGTEERTLSMTTSFAWYTFNFNAPKPSLTANEVYLLVAWAKYTTQYLYIATNTGDTNQEHYKATAWNSWPNPLAPYHNPYKDSIYCTYTPAGPPPATEKAFSDVGGGSDAFAAALFTPTLLTFKDKIVIACTTAVTTTSDTLVDDTEASQTFNLAASKVVLAIYQANNLYGAAMPHLGMQNAVNIDSVDKANSWDSGGNPDNNTRNCVFWLGTLGVGSHTIKGRFASRDGTTATISNRVLLIYIFDGDAYQYVDDVTTATAPDTTMIDDPNAQVTFTPPDACKALVMYNCANSGGAGIYESVYGKKAAINVAGTDYGQAEKGPGSANANYVDSVFTVHALSLSAVSTTVKGRFANAGTAATVYINRRQLAVLLLADSTLMDVATSTTQVSTTSGSLVDDIYAMISRTTTDTTELLVVAMGTKRHGTSAGHYGLCYGIKINANDRTNSRSSPPGLAYAESAATTYAEQLAAGSHTVQGRFSNNSGAETATIDARQVVALWFTGGAIPTEKSFSDVSGGSDAFINPYRAMPFAEVGHGGESFGTPFKAMPFGDVGHGAEAFNTPFRSMQVSDVGHGTDGFLNPYRAMEFLDSGYGADSFSEIITFLNKVFADAGYGTDAFVIPFKALGFTDVGQGTDVFALLRMLAFADVGSGSDAFTQIITFLTKTFGDAGYGADVFLIPFKALAFSDIGYGTDIFTLLRALAFTDIGHGTDAFSIPFKGMAFSDVGHGLDAFTTPFRAMLFTESGQGVDAFVIPFKALGFTDVASGTDSFLKEIWGAISKAFSETATGSDSYSIPFKAMRFADVATGTDLFATPFRAMIFTDNGQGVDVFIIPFRALRFTDAGVGSDSYTREILSGILKAFSDTGLGTDVFLIPFKALSFGDVGQGAETFNTPFRAMKFADVGSGADVFNLLRVLGFTDSGHGTDAFLIPLKALGFSDVGHGTDSFAILFKGLSFSDGGHATDVFIIPFRSMGFSDVGSGADIFALLRMLRFSDAGHCTDAFMKELIEATLKAFADAGHGSDAFLGGLRRFWIFIEESALIAIGIKAFIISPMKVEMVTEKPITIRCEKP